MSVAQASQRDRSLTAILSRPGGAQDEDAHSILAAASRYVRDGRAFAAPCFIENRTPLKIGPFRVTPYLVDHSAFDAYALLVEADGKRVFYSGDFRGHGRKRRLFEAMIADPPGDIDALLMEGTTIGRDGTDERYASETELERDFVKAFRATRGLHFVWTSSQNIDRLVTIFRAAKRTGRVLLIDLYTAVVLEATGRDTIPQSGLGRREPLHSAPPASVYQTAGALRRTGATQGTPRLPGGVA